MSLAPIVVEEDSAMALQQSSILIADVASLEERRRLVRRESARDFAGVAVGVGVGALVWLALLSLLRV
jgi:hypothetical protein